jgi:pimeloyl-ACP methyl ester carboxylesterase
VTAPAELGRLVVGDVRLNVADVGEGPAVLLLHGFPDSLGMWDGVRERLLAAGLRVIAYDLRGFGESSAPAGRRHYVIDAVVGDAIGVIEASCAAGALTVVGHDWGALISWCLCVVRPDLVARHVAISVGHPLAYRHAGIEQKLRSWYALAFQVPGIPERVASARDWTMMRLLAGGHPQLDRAIAEMARPGRLTAGLNYYRANGSAIVRSGTFGSCSVPTLGIYSTRDPYLTERQMTGSERYLSGEWAYERIDDAGHWIPLEQPGRIAELIARWALRA